MYARLFLAALAAPTSTSAPAQTRPAVYAPQGGPNDLNAWFLERLLAQPNKTLALLQNGLAKATKLTTPEIGRGPAKQTLTLRSIGGPTPGPDTVWGDAYDRVFAATGIIAWLPEA